MLYRIDPTSGGGMDAIAEIELDPKQTWAEATVDLTSFADAVQWELWFYYSGDGLLQIEDFSVWTDEVCNLEVKSDELIPAWGGVYDGKITDLKRYRVIYDATEELLKELNFRQYNETEFPEKTMGDIEIQIAKMNDEGSYQIGEDRLPYAVTDTNPIKVAVYGASENAAKSSDIS